MRAAVRQGEGGGGRYKDEGSSEAGAVGQCVQLVEERQHTSSWW